MKFILRIQNLLTGVFVASLLSCLPISIQFSDDGFLKAVPSYALAKKGGGGSDDDDNSGSGSSGGGNSGSGSSGGGHSGSGSSGSGSSGSGSSGSGSSGSGSSGGGHSGSGSSGSGSSGSGSSGSGSSGSGSSGSGSSGSGSSGSGTSTNTGENTEESSGPVIIRKIEVSASGVEIVYSDNSREEIENGRYEQKNSVGRTVEERRATGADIARLSALSRRISINSVRRQGQARAVSVIRSEVANDHIEVTYSNGWKEEIDFGRYELKDQYNRTVVERPATRADFSRLRKALDI